MLRIVLIISSGQSYRRSFDHIISFYQRKYNIPQLPSSTNKFILFHVLHREHESIFNRKYQELLRESCGIRWFSDGSIDVKKSIHLSMGSYFSISNEMTFMIVFNMLYARDRHQLFELLCLQLTSIILSYRESIKEITKCIDNDEEYYKPEEFLNCKSRGVLWVQILLISIFTFLLIFPFFHIFCFLFSHP